MTWLPGALWKAVLFPGFDSGLYGVPEPGTGSPSAAEHHQIRLFTQTCCPRSTCEMAKENGHLRGQAAVTPALRSLPQERDGRFTVPVLWLNSPFQAASSESAASATSMCVSGTDSRSRFLSSNGGPPGAGRVLAASDNVSLGPSRATGERFETHACFLHGWADWEQELQVINLEIDSKWRHFSEIEASPM